MTEAEFEAGKANVKTGFEAGYNFGYAQAKKEFDRPHGGWILCTERLPDKAGDYLATYKSVFSDDVVVDHVRFTKEMGFYYDNVVAWMPLPEPYKAESEEGQ